MDDELSLYDREYYFSDWVFAPLVPEKIFYVIYRMPTCYIVKDWTEDTIQAWELN